MDAAIEKIRSIPGWPRRIAKELGITDKAVYAWPKVPIDRVRDIAKITGMSREQIRPDIFGEAS